MLDGSGVEEVRKKIVLLGDNSVGKTSLIRMFVTNSFDDKYISTIGTKVTKKKIEVKAKSQKQIIHLMIWDIVGQRDYALIMASAFKGAHGAMFVCDVTRRETMDSLTNYWLPNLKKYCGDVPMVFLANKCDLTDQAQFSLHDLDDVARSFDCEGLLTSAKTGKNVEEAFTSLGGQTLFRVGFLETPKPREEIETLPPEVPDTLPKVIDAIIYDFNQNWDSRDDCMSIIRHQAKKVGLNINNPTIEAVWKFIENLKEIELRSVDQNMVDSKFRKRKKWLMDLRK
jgi:small GTP-binding protein